MEIIRDNELGGLMMIPLFVDWGVKRCNVEDCTARPSTIVRQLSPDIPLAGFCEEHFQEANQEGGAVMSFVFDDFDAFVISRVADPAPSASATGGETEE